MGIKRTPAPGPRSVPSAKGTAPLASRVVDPSTAAGLESRREPPLPPAHSSVQGKSSPLSGLIADGLTQLAKAEGWGAQQSALEVLVGAMRSGARAAPEPAPRADGASELAFEGLLGRQVGPERREEARQDARQLARLAVVVLGTAGLDGQKRGDRSAQIAADLAEVRSALAAVVASPDPAKTARLETLAKDLEWVASVLGRSKGTAAAQPRVDALVGLLKILVRYA